jgi:hypothetical protein
MHWRVRFALSRREPVYVTPAEMAELQRLVPASPIYSAAVAEGGIVGQPQLWGVDLVVDAVKAQWQFDLSRRWHRREHPFPDLPGIRMEIGHDLLGDAEVVKVEQRFRDARKVAAIVPMPSEAVRDLGRFSIARYLEATTHRVFCPWEYPDRNPMPWLVPFPRLEWLARAAEALWAPIRGLAR